MGWSGFPLLPFRHGCVSVHETFGARLVYAFRADASLYVVTELPTCLSVRLSCRLPRYFTDLPEKQLSDIQ